MTYLYPSHYKMAIESSYTDSEGLVSKDINPGRWSSGNGALISAIHYTLLHLLGLTTVRDIEASYKAIRLLWDGSGDAIVPGLLERNDGRVDQDAWDNYVGVLVWSHVTKLYSIASLIHDYGASHCWVYQNEPGLKNYFRGMLWRFPGMVPFIKLAARRNIGPIDRFLLRARIEADSSGPGAEITRWLMAIGVLLLTPDLPDGPFSGLRSGARSKLLQIDMFYGSVQVLLSRYYGTSHPFAQLSPFIYPSWLDHELHTAQGARHA